MLSCWKEPRHEVHGADGHADGENDPGHSALRAAFTEGEHEPTENDGHKGEPGGHRAGEGGL